MTAKLLSLEPNYDNSGCIDITYQLIDENGEEFPSSIKTVASALVTSSDDIYKLITAEANLIQSAIDTIASITAIHSPINESYLIPEVEEV